MFGGAAEFEAGSVVDRGHGLLASGRPAVLPAELNEARNAVPRTLMGMSQTPADRHPDGPLHLHSTHPQ
jgi:hypothetical protein